MKKIIIIGVMIGSLLFILTKSGVFNALLLLLLVGVIPGTSYSVPSNTMLLFFASILWLVVFRFLVLEFTQLRSPLKNKKQVLKKDRMPRRRYSQI